MSEQEIKAYDDIEDCIVLKYETITTSLNNCSEQFIKAMHILIALNDYCVNSLITQTDSNDSITIIPKPQQIDIKAQFKLNMTFCVKSSERPQSAFTTAFGYNMRKLSELYNYTYISLSKTLVIAIYKGEYK